jgi:hypothetical protein
MVAGARLLSARSGPLDTFATTPRRLAVPWARFAETDAPLSFTDNRQRSNLWINNIVWALDQDALTALRWSDSDARTA